MSIIKRREILRSLTKKGFMAHPSRHIKITFIYKGQRTAIFTFISHGMNEIGDNLQHQMANQLHLTNAAFEQVIECTLNELDLIKIYNESGLIKQ